MAADTMAMTARAVEPASDRGRDHLELGQEPGGEGDAGLGHEQHAPATRPATAAGRPGPGSARGRGGCRRGPPTTVTTAKLPMTMKV